MYLRQAHHVKAGGMYDDVLHGLGVGSACGGDTRNGRLLAGFTATPRRYTKHKKKSLHCCTYSLPDDV